MHHSLVENVDERHFTKPHQLPIFDDEKSPLFYNQMKLFAQTLGTRNAFVYLIEEQKLLHVGNVQQFSSLCFDSLCESIAGKKSKVAVLASDNDLVSKKTLVYGLAQNQRGKPSALIGSLIPSKAHAYQASDTKIQKTLKLIINQLALEISLRQVTSKAQKQHERHKQIAELNHDFICVKDINHNIVYANKSFLSTFEQEQRAKVLGSSAFEFYEPEMSAQMIHGDLQAFKNGLYTQNEHVVFANGEEKILHVSKKVFTSNDGNTYLMSMSRDITEKEILINDLKRSNNDLDNFAYVASHDLRSPLNVIKRLVTWVNEDCADILPADSKDNLALTLNRVSRMEKLLVDLLSYSRIGKDYQESSSLNLRELVVELLSLIDLPMGFSLNCDDIDIQVPSVPFNVVMRNLISNAIKHHDSGNAKIKIKAKVNARTSIITIEDNGPGIEPKNRERIFKLFETLKPRDEVEGSGMGLSVVKKIVEHYGGSIRVSDNTPRGTKFEVTWPKKHFARPVLASLQNDV